MLKTKNILLLTLLGFTSFSLSQSLSQQLDDNYLNSLPEEIREDVQAELDRNNKDEKIVRRPSSELSRLETVRQYEQFKLMNQFDSDRFGMNLFKSMQSTFMPINEPNFDSSYILDFGDVLSLQLVGNINEISEIEIKRDGSINIDQIGRISLSGLSLNNAAELIKSKVSSAFIGTEAFISLEMVRDIQIFITGGVNLPGIYTLNGNSHLLHALNVAGGISEKGSFRSIDIKRNGETINTIDLYDALISGDTSFNVPLNSGDTIYVKPPEKLVRVSGALNNTGVFELLENENYSDLLRLTGGFSIDAKNRNELILNRILDGKYQESLIAISNLSNVSVKNGDIIYATKFNIGSIEISGEVVNPGKYSITDTDSLSSVIKRAGGYTDNAYVFGSSIFKEKLKKQEEISNAELYSNFIKLIAYGGSSIDPTIFTSVLQEFKAMKPTGRAIAEFNLQAIANDPSLDMLIDNGDVIQVPKFTNSVYVYGQVNKPNAVLYEPNKDLKKYISDAGGYNSLADTSNVIIVKPNGEIQKDEKGRIFLMPYDANIYPGSLIYVPNDAVYQDASIAYISSIAPIISSLVLSIASLNSLN